MDFDAFKQVSTALQGRIEAAVGAASVHVGPIDDDNAATAPLVLFLYRVAVNADLRNAGHRRPAANPNDPPVFYENALPFDLFYLLSASPSKADDDLEGLAQLGKAIQALNDQPIFVGAAVRGEIVRASIDTVSPEELSRVWALFPTVNYRTSVIYLVSPVWIDPATPPAAAAPVVSESYDPTLITG